MINNIRPSVALILSMSFFAPSLSYAEKPTVEWIASEIARQHNANAETMKDETIMSSSAQAIGRNVIFKFVLRVKRDVSKQKLDESRLGLYQEIVPKICRVNSNNSAFKDGLFYTLVYVSQYGQPLAELVVNKRVCGSH
jgi:hypothetical protein